MATKTKPKKPVPGKQFAWREGSRFNVNAQIAGEELERIARANDDNLKPRVVVEESRPEDAPLHPVFEWDDQQAADLYRDEQARQLIRGVRVVVNEEDGILPTPHYVPVRLPETEGRVYVTTARAWSESDLRQQVLREAIGQLRGLKSRYQHLSELGEVFDAIDRLPEP